MSYNHLNRSSSVLALAMVVTFRILQMTHHSAVVFRTICSAFTFCILQFCILLTPLQKSTDGGEPSSWGRYVQLVGEMPRGRNVQGAKRPGGETSRGRNVQWRGETSKGRNVLLPIPACDGLYNNNSECRHKIINNANKNKIQHVCVCSSLVMSLSRQYTGIDRFQGRTCLLKNISRLSWKNLVFKKIGILGF